MVVQTDVFMVNHRDLIVAAAARYKVPAIYPVPLFARSGGLAAYGIQPMELYRDAALYVDRTHSQGGEAGRPASAGTDQVRVCPQHEDRQGAWAHGA
jgi:putative ABC transport system substrate-binding protein